MTSWDVSPDGTKVVFSGCGRNPPGGGEYQFLDGDPQSRWVLVGKDDRYEYYEPLLPQEVYKHSFEIMVSNMDGSDVKRLTENGKEDNFPAWSPDGSRIAFFSGGLHTMASDGTDWHGLAGGLASLPPAWAPDGEHIAVVGEGFGLDEVYTVRIDGSEVFTIVTDALSAPSWSPDGQRIAVAVPDGEGGAVLRTFAPDGTEPATIASIDVAVVSSRDITWAVPNLSWSPDGSKIMYRCKRALCAVNVEDGSLVFDSLPLKLYGDVSGPFELVAAWSPDGSRIAVMLPLQRLQKAPGDPWLFTMDSDGKNPHVVMDYDGECVKPVSATSTPIALTGIPYFGHTECG